MTHFTFVQLTDLHLQAPGTLLYGRDPWIAFRAALADIAARHGPAGPAPAQCVIVTGDLAHQGSVATYRALRDALAELPMPAHLMLGNHDDRAAFRAAFPEAAVDAHGFVQAAIPTPAGRLLLLDTHEPGEVAGRLCARRLGWLADRLAEEDGPVLLFLHHQVVRLGLALDRVGLRDAEALWAVLAPHRARVRHLFHGHCHRPLAGSWRGVPFSALRGTHHQFALDFDAAVPLCGLYEPPAYAVVRLTGEDVVVHTHEFLGTGAGFPLS